jgi:hypothetical protein
MRVERALVGLLCVITAASAGCGGKLAYNLPPAARLMEPGPGVGGPGPGVIPPAGNPYGMYGGAVGRFGDGGGQYMGGGYGECAPGAPCAANEMPTQNAGGVMQAGYSEGCAEGCESGDAYGYGDGCGSAEMCDAYGCSNAYGCDDGCTGGGCGDGGCAVGQCLGVCRGPGCGGCGGAGCGHSGGLLGGLLHGHGRWAGHGSTEAYADGGMMANVPTSQIAFLGEDGVQVSWDVGGYGVYDSTALVIPGRQDFYQGAIYRLKLTNIPGRPGVELYPTLEVAPVTPRTDAYLAHSPIPVQFTAEDFDQVLSGNFVTKVIYLPDPEFQELALAGVETLVSTRLDPGVDPIAEADRRGSILAIVRMGNKDLEPGYGMSTQVDPAVVPMSHESSVADANTGCVSQATYEEPVDAEPINDPNVTQAQYGAPYGPGYCGEYGAGQMPMGMPTAGFAPPAVPPNMIAGAPQWGMPITGTPIGLPGPPHIPLGTPAGLRQHVMHNRTRVLMPPPVAKTKITVKHRPGLNYPRPVNHVSINETQREPVRLVPSWLSNLFHHNRGGAHADPNCQ